MFYVRDHLTDTQLRAATPSTKGIWVDSLCLMHVAPNRGILTGTVPELCRLLGITEQEFTTFLDEVKRLQFASVTEDNRIITLVNRRMVRDEKERKDNALRQARYRKSKGNAKGNEKITAAYAFASSVASSKEDSYVGSDTPDATEDIPIPGKNDCPHQGIIALYHETLPTLPRVRQWTPKRQKYLKARWLSSPEYQNLEWWSELFRYIAGKCPHLTGKNDRQWTADLEWIVQEGNFVKIVEGRYEQK